MVVCKAFQKHLPPLITEITYSSPVLSQQSFERLASTFTNLETFIVYQNQCGYDPPVLDWSKVWLPHLQHLDLNYCPMKSIEFNQANTPSLEKLCISHNGVTADAFKLDLPKLQGLSFENTCVSVQAACQQFLLSMPYLPTALSVQSDCCTNVHAVDLSAYCYPTMAADSIIADSCSSRMEPNLAHLFLPAQSWITLRATNFGALTRSARRCTSQSAPATN